MLQTRVARKDVPPKGPAPTPGVLAQASAWVTPRDGLSRSMTGVTGLRTAHAAPRCRRRGKRTGCVAQGFDNVAPTVCEDFGPWTPRPRRWRGRLTDVGRYATAERCFGTGVAVCFDDPHRLKVRQHSSATTWASAREERRQGWRGRVADSASKQDPQNVASAPSKGPAETLGRPRAWW